MNIRSIGIIGGTNGLGACFAEYFENRGSSAERQKGSKLEVLVSGRNTDITNKKIVQECDLVIFAVPISVTEQVMEEMVPYAKKDQVWADFTSVKTSFVQKMCSSCAQVIGMHPLFGPMQDIRGQKVFYVPERINNTSLESVLDLFSEFDLIKKSAQDHDRLMGVIQNVSHFSEFVMGETLRRLGYDMKELMEYSTASYKLKLEVMGRMFAQSGDLYANIATQNKEGIAFSAVFTEVAHEYLGLVQGEDAVALEREFDSISGYLGDCFCRESFVHSQRFMKAYVAPVLEPELEGLDLVVFGDQYSHTDEASKKFVQDLGLADTTVNIDEKKQSLATNTEQPVIGYVHNIFEVFGLLNKGKARFGVVPYENSTRGSVFDTLDGLFVSGDVRIVQLREMSIGQHLLGLPGAKLKELKKIYSHPQALAQVKDWVVVNLPHVEMINASSTTRAGRQILQDGDVYSGAIGSIGLAEGLGLDILEKDLQLPGNRTKFVLLEKRSVDALVGGSGVSFAVWFSEDKSGSLAEVLGFLAQNDINLTKLDSRRAQDPKYGGYWFFMDAEIGIDDFRKYLPELEQVVAGVRVLGAW